MRPVGSQPPSVYWRRRLLVAASVVVLVILLVLTAKAVFSDGGGKPAAGGATGSHTTASAPAGSTGSSSTPSSAGGTSPNSAGLKTSPVQNQSSPVTGSTVKNTPVRAAKCLPAQLKVQAVVGQPTYKVGDEPVLTLQVTNAGPAPCVQDVGDPQIVLRVYNGASRVWGSHDCKTTPGVVEKTLPVGSPAGFSMTWSGLTAQPGCAGTRQRVGAGTYTLYATLAGINGKAAQFAIS